MAGRHPPTSCADTSVVLQARVLAGTPGTGPYTDFKVEVFGVGAENCFKKRTPDPPSSMLTPPCRFPELKSIPNNIVEGGRGKEPEHFNFKVRVPYVHDFGIS